MKFPFSMLTEFVCTSLNVDEVGDLLTMAGFELEGIETVGDESVLDIKVCSNRGDGLSVFGLARELLAKDGEARPTQLYLDAADWWAKVRTPVPAGLEGPVKIETDACTRYSCMVFDHSTKEASKPWMQRRLEQAGMRPVSLVVDITNYVLLELGHPLHAFDQDRLDSGQVVVREARPGEKIITLNGLEHELRPGQMMICDRTKPVAVAGVMGGLDSEVTDSTRRILLESAHFVNTSVRRTRKQLGLGTEASYRFERSVDPEGTIRALWRFAELYRDCGGSAPVILQDLYPLPPEPRRVSLRIQRADRLLGMPIAPSDAKGYLERLGMDVAGSGNELSVAIPTWRPDIQREEDLIEELGRVHGYDKIPSELPFGATSQGGTTGLERLVDNFRNALLQCGFDQMISHTLRDKSPLDADCTPVVIRNPGSPDMAMLRSSPLPGLAEAARRNGTKDLHLFEIARCFANIGRENQERLTLGVLDHGELVSGHWRNHTSLQADFFSLKGVVEAVSDRLGLELTFTKPGEATDRRFHPTQQARILIQGQACGVLGTINPDVAAEADLQEGAVLAELDLETVFSHARAQTKYESISRNPSVRRDIAVTISKHVPFSDIASAIKRAAGQLLERNWLFDVYEGANIQEGHHSLGMALQLRKHGENFTDEEANLVRDAVVKELESLGATQR